MLTGPAREMFRSVTGPNDEAMAKFDLGEAKLFRNVPKMMQYQTIVPTEFRGSMARAIT